MSIFPDLPLDDHVWSLPVQAALKKQNGWAGPMVKNEKNKHGMTAFMEVVRHSRGYTNKEETIELIHTMIQEGADLYIEGPHGQTLWSNCGEFRVIPPALMLYWDVHHRNQRGEYFLHEVFDDPELDEYLEINEIPNFLGLVLPHCWDQGMTLSEHNHQGLRLNTLLRAALVGTGASIESLYADYEQKRLQKQMAASKLIPVSSSSKRL